MVCESAIHNYYWTWQSSATLLLRWHWWAFVSLNNRRLRFSRDYYHRLIVLNSFSVPEHKSRGGYCTRIRPLIQGLEPWTRIPRAQAPQHIMQLPSYLDLKPRPRYLLAQVRPKNWNKITLNTSSKTPPNHFWPRREHSCLEAPYAQLPNRALDNVTAKQAAEMGISSNATPTFPDRTSTLRWWNWTTIRTKKEK